MFQKLNFFPGVLVTSILCLIGYGLHSQSLKQPIFSDLEVTNSITRSYGDTTVTFHIQVEKSDINPSMEKRYYWYNQGELKSTVGNYTGKLLHGPFEKLDRKGNLLEKGTFSHGLKDGSWMRWYVNGNVAQNSQWDKGQPDGELRQYYADGKLFRVSNYKNGKLHGKQLVYNSDGSLANSQQFRNGEYREEKIKQPKENSDSTRAEKRKVRKEKKQKAQSPEQTVTPGNETQSLPEENQKKKRRRKEKEETPTQN
jgi:hypothetical protein